MRAARFAPKHRVLIASYVDLDRALRPQAFRAEKSLKPIWLALSVSVQIPSTDTATPATATSPSLMAAPGYIVRRLYQAYLAAWLSEVSATLTGPQFAVLTQVRDSPGVDQGSLASMVRIDSSTMTDIAHRLESKGFLRRPADHNDGRRKLLYLTDEGEQVLIATNAGARALDTTLMSAHTLEQSEVLLAQLTALAEHWESLT